MNNNKHALNNNSDSMDDYDFLDLSFNQTGSLEFGRKFGGKRGITFETNPKKFIELDKKIKSNKSLQKHKIINENPLKIKINEKNKEHFDFTICLEFMECLNGKAETTIILENALKLSKNFVYISQPNFDSDMILFKNGFKTFFSDWSRHTNPITSNIYFNLIFDFYKKGFIEDYLIFYTTPIENSSDPIIHPLNSPKNQPEFNEDSHPAKNERVKFKNVFRNLNVIITKQGYKKIDDIYEKLSGEKLVIYDSRLGIYDDSTEEFDEKSRGNGKGIFGKVNKFLN